MKTFDDLFAELSDKARERPEGSGTVAQLDAGIHAIGKKIVEEAAEVKAAEVKADDKAEQRAEVKADDKAEEAVEAKADEAVEAKADDKAGLIDP